MEFSYWCIEYNSVENSLENSLEISLEDSVENSLENSLEDSVENSLEKLLMGGLLEEGLLEKDLLLVKLLRIYIDYTKGSLRHMSTHHNIHLCSVYIHPTFFDSCSVLHKSNEHLDCSLDIRPY